MPAYSSRIIQFLDFGCFGPLQRIYNSERHKYIRGNHNLVPLFTKLLSCLQKPMKILFQLLPLSQSSSVQGSIHLTQLPKKIIYLPQQRHLRSLAHASQTQSIQIQVLHYQRNGCVSLVITKWAQCAFSQYNALI